MIRVLLRLLAWLGPEPDTPWLARARELTADAERYGHRSGEWRRHVVYARLIKEFPMVSRRELSKAIEQGLP